MEEQEAHREGTEEPAERAAPAEAPAGAPVRPSSAESVDERSETLDDAGMPKVEGTQDAWTDKAQRVLEQEDSEEIAAD